MEEQLRTAQIALGLGRFDEAIEGFEAVLAAQPDHPTAQAGLQAAQESKAGQEQAETRRKQQITRLSGQASRAAEAGQVEEALELYRQWLQLEPDSRTARRDLERVQRKELERVEAMNQNFSDGRSHYNERDYERSIQEFEQALQLARLPEEKQKIHSALNTVRQAQAESRQAAQERAQTIASAYQEAEDLYQDKLFEQALEEVNRVLALDPDHRGARRLKRSIASALEKP
jgi:tetratricopeptide (TPR) repeat protein